MWCGQGSKVWGTAGHVFSLSYISFAFFLPSPFLFLSSPFYSRREAAPKSSYGPGEAL